MEEVGGSSRRARGRQREALRWRRRPRPRDQVSIRITRELCLLWDGTAVAINEKPCPLKRHYYLGDA